MQCTIYVTVGLVASGKTTWAEAFVKAHPGTMRINKDEIRLRLHKGEYSREQEDQVCEMRDYFIESALIGGCNVICDDTNLHPKHIMRIKEIAKGYNAIVDIKDFTRVSKEICIERDEKRGDKAVGRDVIERMWNDHFENGQWKYRKELLDG